jgi:hypothetical protein
MPAKIPYSSQRSGKSFQSGIRPSLLLEHPVDLRNPRCGSLEDPLRSVIIGAKNPFRGLKDQTQELMDRFLAGDFTGCASTDAIGHQDRITGLFGTSNLLIER